MVCHALRMQQNTRFRPERSDTPTSLKDQWTYRSLDAAVKIKGKVKGALVENGINGLMAAEARPPLRMKMGLRMSKDRNRNGGETPSINLIRPTMTNL